VTLNDPQMTLTLQIGRESTISHEDFSSF